jgi:hypothetical protein
VTGIQGIVFGSGQGAVPVQGTDVGKSAAPGSEEVIATSRKTIPGTSIATHVQPEMDEAPTGKAGVEGSGENLNSLAPQSDPTMSKEDVAKSDAVTASATKNGNGMPSAVAAATVAHTEATSNAATSGGLPGMAFGHALADVIGVKVQAGEVVAHATGLHAGSAEQDGAGAVDMGEMHRMLGATPTSLEVGVANGTQGWLKIRAEMTGNGLVNASLSSATPAGQEMLHRELPALTAYLHQEQVTVNAVVVHANIPADTTFQSAGEMNAEGRGQMQQRNHEGGGEEERQGTANVASDRADDPMTYGGLNGAGENGLLSPGMFIGGGGYLNVRA